ncbi:MAG TPA: hypothetical protein PLR96_03780 [Flavobacteriales bacterium]|nr:hypothetical protein [Flavobacteriales bacterium]
MAAHGVNAADIEVAAYQVPNAEAQVQVVDGVDRPLRGVVIRMEAHVLQVDADEREGLEGCNVAATHAHAAHHVLVDLRERMLHQLVLFGIGHHHQHSERGEGHAKWPKQVSQQLSPHGSCSPQSKAVTNSVRRRVAPTGWQGMCQHEKAPVTGLFQD